jgi:putative SOS response-associated peptidase YedK
VCNLYSITSNQAAIRALARTIKDMAGNLPRLPAVFPDQMAPVVINAPPGGERELMMMRWGFPQPGPRPGEKPRPGYVTNVRNTASGYWKPYLRPEFRCLVPVTSFCEYQDGSKPAIPTWFALDESRPLFFFAGVWRGWEGRRGTKAEPAEGKHLVFSFLTTAANAVVAPVHAKAMPVCLLTETDRETWLTGSVDAAIALQHPAANDALKIVASGLKQDG